MRQKTRNGQLIELQDTQDKFLSMLYGSLLGRCLVKVLVMPWISKLGGAVLSTKLSTLAIPSFIRSHQLDMSQFEDVTYNSYNEFFMRKIKPGARDVDTNPTHLISPCDCKLTVLPVEEDGHFMIKQTPYTLTSLLKNEEEAKRYQGGTLCIFRLTVDDYHRYCYIDDAEIVDQKKIPGVLHRWRQGDINGFLGDGMDEGQTVGPQGGGAVGVFAAIADVAQQRQLPGGELHPDLVGAAGMELYPHQGKIIRAPDLPVGQLGFPHAFAHTLHYETLVVSRVPEKKVGEGIIRLLRVAPQYRQILLGDAVLGHQGCQLAGDLLAAGKDHHTAGDLVQPVDGSDVVRFAGGLIVLTQPLGHTFGAAVIFGEIVDGLAAHHQMGVFVEDDRFHSALLIKKQTQNMRLLLCHFIICGDPGRSGDCGGDRHDCHSGVCGGRTSTR